MQDTLAPSLPLAVVSRRNEKSVMKMESGFASFQRVPAGNMKRVEPSTVPMEVRWVTLCLWFLLMASFAQEGDRLHHHYQVKVDAYSDARTALVESWIGDLDRVRNISLLNSQFRLEPTPPVELPVKSKAGKKHKPRGKRRPRNITIWRSSPFVNVSDQTHSRDELDCQYFVCGQFRGENWQSWLILMISQLFQGCM